MKKMNMYVAPKAEVIEMQTVTVLMESTPEVEHTSPINVETEEEP
jgi:hypothetical protein